MTSIVPLSSACDIGRAVASGRTTAREIMTASLARIATLNPDLGAFTDVTAERALRGADAVDAARARGETLGPLAGAPFSVKNLFDVEGLPTRAGSKINRERRPAVHDAFLVRKLEAAGAILVGALNMGEYAYDFTGQNAHDGPSRNPHALDHMTGGSSGGSGAAVAGGLTPIALGSDTNGSIRVPASLCGIFGLKPTYGRLSRGGAFPFVSSLDHLGPLATSVEDLAASYDAMQGQDEHDPAQAFRPFEPASPSLNQSLAGLRIAKLGGYFARGADTCAFDAVDRLAAALGATETTEFPEAERARAAAYLITMTEGAALHLERLKARMGDFDPDVRDRLIAGAMLPGSWSVKAHKLRRFLRERGRRRCGRPSSDRRRSFSTARRCLCARTSASSRSPFPSSAYLWSLYPSGPMASACRSACRSSLRLGGRIFACASLASLRSAASRPYASQFPPSLRDRGQG